jgi:ketosteroid isomerase-like protein
MRGAEMRGFLGALVAATLALTATTAQEKKEAPNLVPAFEKAFANTDADALAALYFEDAVLLPPNEPKVIGRAEIRKWYVKSFSSGVSHFKMDSRALLYEGPVGYERGAYSVRVPGAARNGEALTDTRKYVWTLRKSPTGWLIDSHMFNSDR